ncbi:MAG: transposase [Planctomycetes bacterium]|nr:transposase [Planctomycetota bacterium]
MTTLGPSRTHAFDQHLKRKLCERYNTAGEAHALTFSCFQRRPFLGGDRARFWFLEALDDARRKLRFEVWAFVIMPEHVHLLIYPIGNEYSISDFLMSVKRPVARKTLRHVQAHAPSFLVHMRDAQPNGRTQYRFWQRDGGYDRNLVSDSTIHRTIDYIHANPVRRGLAPLPEEWRWSSAAYLPA